MPIKFLNDVAVDTNVLYVDTINNRVGVGTSSPDETFTLQTQGDGLGNEGIFIKNPFAGTSPIVNSKNPFLSLATSTTSAYNSTIYMGRNATATNQESKIEWSNANDGLSIYVKGTGTYREHVRFGNLSSGTPRTYFGGNVGIGTTSPSQKLHVAGNARVTGAYYDSNNLPGTSGQVLSSTATGTDWVSLSEIQGVDGTGTANTVAMWSDSDTITDAPITVSGNNSTFAGDVLVEDNLYLTDAGTVRGKIQLNASDRDDLDIKAVSLGSNMKFFTVDTERMRIDSSGNVGIGTTSPARTFHSKGGSGVSTIGKFEAGTANAYIQISSTGQSDADSGYIGYDSSRVMTFWTANTERMRINSSGNVGIGTSSPDTILEVVDENPILTVRDTSTGLSSANAALRLAESGSGDTLDNYWDLKMKPEPVGGTTNFAIANNSLGEVLNINYQGNVGIGVTPEAWVVFNPVLRIGAGGSLAGTGVSNFRMFANTYYDGSYKRIGSGFATQYEQDGYHAWYTAASGAANSAISWSERMRIDSSGNVGIGTTSPSSAVGFDAKLQLESANPMLVYKETDQSTKWEVGAWGGNYVVYNGTNERMRITSAGNVGIGTTNPTGKLEVRQAANNGNTGAFTNTHVKLTASATADNTGFVGITAATSTANNYGYSFGAQRTSGGVGSFKINYHNNSAAGTNRFIIDQNGNVGINTTNPNQKLTIKGNDNYVATEHTSYAWGAANTIGVRMGTDATAGLLDFRRWTGTSAIHGTALITQVNSDGGYGLDFRVDNKSTNTSATTSRMYLSTSGEVGIGTTSPQQKLDVNGDIAIKNATQLSFDSNNGTLSVASHAGQLDLLSSSIFINYSSNVGIGTTTPSYLLEVSGSAAKSTGTTWINTSDERTKENIQNYTKGLNDIVQLQPRVFDYNGKGSTEKSKENIGLIAQEVIDVYPEAISTFKAKLDETDAKETDIYNLDFHSISISMINAIKELNEKVKILEDKIQTLENQ